MFFDLFCNQIFFSNTLRPFYNTKLMREITEEQRLVGLVGMEGNTNSKPKLKMMRCPSYGVDARIEELGERVMWRERCSEGRGEYGEKRKVWKDGK
jgi:hypothetical protein